MITQQTTLSARKWQSLIIEKKPGCWQIVQYLADQPSPSLPVVTPIVVRQPAIPLCRQPLKDSDPLAVFVCKTGGLNPDYARGMRQGEIRRIRELGQGLPPGAINSQARLTLEEMAESAFMNGYTFDPAIDAFLDALEQDVNACAIGDKAKRVYSYVGKETIQVGLMWQQWNDSQEEVREAA